MLVKLMPLLLLPALGACSATSSDGGTSAASKQKLDGVMITTLPAPGGWKIKETKGMHCRFFQYAGEGDYVEKFNSATAAIQEEAKKQGAQALVNLRVTSASYEIQGSKWHASVLNLCGDLVTLE